MDCGYSTSQVWLYVNGGWTFSIEKPTFWSCANGKQCDFNPDYYFTAHTCCFSYGCSRGAMCSTAGVWQVFLHWCRTQDIAVDVELFNLAFYSPEIERVLEECEVEFVIEMQQPKPTSRPDSAGAGGKAGTTEHWFR